MRKGLIVALILAAAVAATAGAYYRYGRTAEEIKVSTLPIDRGGIAETVGATGTLEAVNTVQVGTQVSGNIKALHATSTRSCTRDRWWPNSTRRCSRRRSSRAAPT